LQHVEAGQLFQAQLAHAAVLRKPIAAR